MIRVQVPMTLQELAEYLSAMPGTPPQRAERIAAVLEAVLAGERERVAGLLEASAALEYAELAAADVGAGVVNEGLVQLADAIREGGHDWTIRGGQVVLEGQPAARADEARDGNR